MIKYLKKVKLIICIYVSLHGWYIPHSQANKVRVFCMHQMFYSSTIKFLKPQIKCYMQGFVCHLQTNIRGRRHKDIFGLNMGTKFMRINYPKIYPFTNHGHLTIVSSTNHGHLAIVSSTNHGHLAIVSSSIIETRFSFNEYIFFNYQFYTVHTYIWIIIDKGWTRNLKHGKHIKVINITKWYIPGTVK